jgi:type I restriction enzyme S subunit
MMSWRACTLGDVLTLQRGFDLPERERRPGTVPIVSSSGVTGFHDEPRAHAPGVVTGRYGTLGEVFFVRQDYWPLNTALFVKDFKGNDPRFASYLLRTLAFGRQNAAGAVPGVNRNHLHGLPVRVPDRRRQKRIAEILGAYDDLIENNTRRTKVLEEMARSLYREWFIDFRFPHHNQNVKLVGSALGHVPSAWRVAPLSEGCSALVDGDWVESKDQGGSSYRLLQVSNIGVGRFVETGNFRYISEETFARLRCTEVVPGDILVSRMPTPIGRAWLVTSMPWRMVTAVDVAILRANPDALIPSFAVAQLNTDAQLERAAKSAGGTTRARIARRDLALQPFLYPPVPLQREFESRVAALREQSLALGRVTENARRTRDLLLPRLISGEIEFVP